MAKSTFLLSILLFVSAIIFAQSEIVFPQGLKVGDMAPDFSSKDQNGNTFNLSKALQTGDVVMFFYRGQWCPYCTKQLSNYSDSLAMFTAKGAILLAITPETAENIKKTIEKTKTNFPVIEDEGMAIMKLYKVNFAVDEKTVTKYKGYGIDFDKANGTNAANLPVPAIYIIGKDRKIKYVFFNTDYKKRASADELLKNL